MTDTMATLPLDSAYEAQIAALQRQRDSQFAQLAQERSSGLLDYGYREGANGQLAVDPNNPFSKAALLKQSYDRTRRATGQSMGAAGQLNAGAFQNAQDSVNRNELQGNDSLQKSLLGFLARNTMARATTSTNYETDAGTAEGEAVGRFRSNGAYSPDTPDTGTVTPAAAVARPVGPTKATASAGRPTKTVRGQRFYQRASDKKWIRL